MAKDEKTLPGIDVPEKTNGKSKKNGNGNGWEPPNLGKAIRMTVPDFNDPNRPLTCLEVDFPIAPINALSNLEGNAGKPIYQMSKWWARRRSSIFRAMLIAAATQAPEDRTHAAKHVWDHYYANHQRAGSFKKLRVLEPFMGGGTTLVEGARLGFQLTGIDLNPVAWFVCKNELACSDPELVAKLFDEIEAEVKPQIQPFYTTTCPRGHKGKWIDTETGQAVDVDPLTIPPEQRKRYRWEGPEVIYTFWAKHGPCKTSGCGHRTPIFRSPVIAQKSISRFYIPTTCPSCKTEFNIELGETRMAPGADRIVLDTEPAFTETSQAFAQLLKDYDKGNARATAGRTEALLEGLDDEESLCCPECGTFAAHELKDVLQRHRRAERASQVKKKHFGIKRGKVQMWLLIHPDWLEGAPGFMDEEQTHEYGGYAGAPAEDTIAWYEKRLETLALVEIRGEELPDEFPLPDGRVSRSDFCTAPGQAKFQCQACGPEQELLASVEETGHTAPVAAYALLCYCPHCQADGHSYSGRYFKPVDDVDAGRLSAAETEWDMRSRQDLSRYWPRQEIQYSMRTHIKDPLPRHGYTHWSMLFNSRQLLGHALLLQSIMSPDSSRYPLDTREQVLGAFQPYLRNQNMFAFYHMNRDCLAPFLSNANFNPKNRPIEVGVFSQGYGPWQSTSRNVLNGLEYAVDPWDPFILPPGATKVSNREAIGDPVIPGSVATLCRSATDLVDQDDGSYDLAVTDPPFGDNIYYADVADFFYVWLRIPLLQWYRDMPESKYFGPTRTPHAVEAIDNAVEHPDDREAWEKEGLVTAAHLARILELAGDPEIEEGQKNPLYRPRPSSEFYCNTLTACWAEARRLLKPGGLLAFTFHHSEDAPWVDVLESLFNAGYFLAATYPVRSDETKGENAEFGSKKIEYDIVHVCRKRLDEPLPVAWAKMRRWVKEEAIHLRNLLEHSHGKDLPESDLLVILRGKALEFYSRHYGQVFTGDGQVLSVGEALLGINQLLEDLIAGDGADARKRPPEAAEPASRLYLRIFTDQDSIPRDELHKTLRGTGIAPADLEARGWVRAQGTTVHSVPIIERFQYFTAPGRKRVVLKTDLDQAHFLIGAAMGGSGVNIDRELNGGTWTVKRSVDPVLTWYAEMDPDEDVRDAAKTAAGLVSHWRSRPKPKPVEQMTLFDRLDAEED